MPIIKNFKEVFPGFRGKGNGGRGFIYALEFSTGVVKIGSSQLPAARIDNHRAAAARFGIQITRGWLSSPLSVFQGVERRLIKDALAAGYSVAAREWFQDLPFEIAVEQAELLVSSQRCVGLPPVKGEGLSPNAGIILQLALSHAEGVPLTQTDLYVSQVRWARWQGRRPMGTNAVKKALAELKVAGYYRVVTASTGRGGISSSTSFSDEPLLESV